MMIDDQYVMPPGTFSNNSDNPFPVKTEPEVGTLMDALETLERTDGIAPRVLRQTLEAAKEVKHSVVEPEILMTIDWQGEPRDAVHIERLPHKRGYAESGLWITVYADGCLGFRLDFTRATQRIVSAEHAPKIMALLRASPSTYGERGRGDLDFYNLWLYWKNDALCVRVAQSTAAEATFQNCSTVITGVMVKRAYNHIYAIWSNVARKQR